MELLEVQGVSKNFGGIIANSDISLELHEGEILGLIGPNGAGKTTLFNTICGFHKPTKGDIFFSGNSIIRLRPSAICKKGIVKTFQIAKPFPELTVLENVMVGAYAKTNSRSAAKEKSANALDIVGLLERENDLAKGLTVVDLKKLEIARALATAPKVLLLDEVMQGLTPIECDNEVALLKKIRETLNLSIIVIEHVMRAVMSFAERIIVLDQGKVIANGTPKEVASDTKVIEAYLGDELEEMEEENIVKG